MAQNVITATADVDPRLPCRRTSADNVQPCLGRTGAGLRAGAKRIAQRHIGVFRSSHVAPPGSAAGKHGAVFGSRLFRTETRLTSWLPLRRCFYLSNADICTAILSHRRVFGKWNSLANRWCPIKSSQPNSRLAATSVQTDTYINILPILWFRVLPTCRL